MDSAKSQGDRGLNGGGCNNKLRLPRAVAPAGQPLMRSRRILRHSSPATDTQLLWWSLSRARTTIGEDHSIVNQRLADISIALYLDLKMQLLTCVRVS